MSSIPEAARRALAAALSLIVSLAVAGCGFHPLHGTGNNGTAGSGAAIASLRIAPIADRSGQYLRNLLLDRLTPLGDPVAPKYVLAVTLNESKRELALQQDEQATRTTLTVRARFYLSPVGQALRFTGESISSNGYNVSTSDFATLSAERDARQRGLRAVSEDIAARVGAALGNPAMFKPVRPQGATR